MIETLLNIVIDGQAWLYASQFKLMAELMGREVSQEEFERWEDEWKEQTSALILEAMEDTDEQTSNPS